MNNRLLIAFAGALAAAACASSTTTVEDVGPSTPAIGDMVPAVVDASGATSWVAVEKLYPEAPYLTLVHADHANQETYGVVFTCNLNTGVLSGRIHGQPRESAGQQAAFKMQTIEGETYTLPGAYEAAGDSADFVFGFDWLKIKDLTEAERTDFVDNLGGSQLAVVSEASDIRGNTALLVSDSGLKEAQSQFYYDCNPK